MNSRTRSSKQKVRKMGSPGLSTSLSWMAFAETDDFLTRNLVDNMYFWIETRKISHGYQRGLMIDREVLLKILKKQVVKMEKLCLDKCTESLMNTKAMQTFLRRYNGDEEVLSGIRSHVQRYLCMYHESCGFELAVTDRFKVKTGMSECCVIARRDFDKNEEVKYLAGSLSPLVPGEEEPPIISDFSVINIPRCDYPCLLLGPIRFVNHNCSPNAKFVMAQGEMKIITLKRILVGEEITVSYSNSYFGEDNMHCLCATCEAEQKGYYDPGRFQIPAFAELIEVLSSDMESDTEVIELDSDDPSSSSVLISSDSETEETNSGIHVHQQRASRMMRGLEMNHKTFKNLKGYQISGKILRDRQKIHRRGSMTSILDSLPLDCSTDSKLLQAKIDQRELERRSRNRTLHKLYMKELYQTDQEELLETTYDCLNCGIYFRCTEKFPFVNYCERCRRHQLIFNSAWPGITSNSGTKCKRLNLNSSKDRPSIADVIKMKTSMTCKPSRQNLRALTYPRAKIKKPSITMSGRKTHTSKFTRRVLAYGQHEQPSFLDEFTSSDNSSSDEADLEDDSVKLLQLSINVKFKEQNTETPYNKVKLKSQKAQSGNVGKALRLEWSQSQDSSDSANNECRLIRPSVLEVESINDEITYVKDKVSSYSRNVTDTNVANPLESVKEFIVISDSESDGDLVLID
ncbi:unnamed protein product [Cyberlindnera jadinii]|uniref:SET domain-containing protein n=1 Tax=Cyberlindnera jadinii (strain ATCC 18201 / CBS 1600 / BCRC 20928 / JCM 3617 / NBRC 0987 / NRRL Y-1542) TaxID=983966 RepID=A0A0H5C8E6_CYBJN|nr:unnamed protein product [Cyberlindnera jadinii]